MTIEEKVLDRIRPTVDEDVSLQEAARSILKAIKDDPEVKDCRIEPRLVGSVAKGTHLRGTDLDMFLIFPKEHPFERLVSCCSRLGTELLEDKEERFADHPYVHGKYKGQEVDLVPCYEMDPGERVRSAVDRSPLHTDHIMGEMMPCHKDEARLLKAFMKGIGVYGADSKTRGFSGYLSELLVIHYGGFLATLEEARAWSAGLSIGVEDSERDDGSPLMVPDPVDPRRNVASALHIDSFALMVHASASYLMQPDERFFFPAPRKDMDREEVEMIVDRRGCRMLSVTFEVALMSEDNLHSQGHKTLNGLRQMLERKGFPVLRCIYHLDSEMHLLFELESDSLPPVELHDGPPIWMRNSSDFLEKWRGSELGEPFIEQGRWRVHRRREHLEAADCLLNGINEVSLGAGLDPVNMVVRGHTFTMRDAPLTGLTALLDTRMPWEI